MLVQYLVPDQKKLTSRDSECKKCRLTVASGLMVTPNPASKTRVYHAGCFIKKQALDQFDISALTSAQATEFKNLLDAAHAAADAREIGSPRDSEQMSEPQNAAAPVEQLPAIPEQPVGDEWEQYRLVRNVDTNMERFAQISKKDKLVELRLGKSNRSRDTDTIKHVTYDSEDNARRAVKVMLGLWQRVGFEIESEA